MVSNVKKALHWSKDLYMSRFAFNNTDAFLRFLIQKRFKVCSVQQFSGKVNNLILEMIIFEFVVYWRSKGQSLNLDMDISAMLNWAKSLFPIMQFVTPGDIAMAYYSIANFKCVSAYTRVILVTEGLDEQILLNKEFCAYDKDRVEYKLIKAGSDRQRCDFNLSNVLRVLADKGIQVKQDQQDAYERRQDRRNQNQGNSGSNYNSSWGSNRNSEYDRRNDSWTSPNTKDTYYPNVTAPILDNRGQDNTEWFQGLTYDSNSSRY